MQFIFFIINDRSEILNHSGIIVFFSVFGIVILIVAKAKKRSNATADEADFDFEVSVERRPETFLVLVVTVKVDSNYLFLSNGLLRF